MASILEQSHGILEHDVDPDFLATIARNLGWEYPRLYEELVNEPNLDPVVLPELFSKRRPECATQAMVAACKKHGVPYEFRTLPCNGQKKLLVKTGRVVLIQEPMLELSDDPRASDYKRDLVAATGFTQQLEFDFGNPPGRVIDWTGSVVAVLLHAAAGPKFTEEQKALGGLLLGVPDENYASWLMRLDLHRIAMFGFDSVADGIAPAFEPRGSVVQKDEVKVELRPHNKRQGRRDGEKS